MTTTQAAETPNLLDRTFHQLVDGRLVDGAGTDPVIDPGTGEPTANAPMADGGQVDESVILYIGLSVAQSAAGATVVGDHAHAPSWEAHGSRVREEVVG